MLIPNYHNLELLVEDQELESKLRHTVEEYLKRHLKLFPQTDLIQKLKELSSNCAIIDLGGNLKENLSEQYS